MLKPLLYCLYMNRVKAFFAGFIPKHISSKAVLGFMNLFSFRIPKSLRERHLKENNENWEATARVVEKNGFLEEQSLMTGITLGNRKASVNACEVMAAYNALRSLGETPSFPALVERFERMGLCLFGAFGTAPAKLKRFFREAGIGQEALSGKALTKEAAEGLEKRYETFVVTVYNDRENIMAMIHTMCISRVNGGFTVHNSGSSGVVFPSLSEAVFSLNGGRAKPLWLLGVSGTKRR